MPHKIVITGPESTGKSTLCKSLSEHYASPMVPEYARSFLEKNGSDYNLDDVISMAKQQSLNIDLAFAECKSTFLFVDTDLLNFKIWIDFKYGLEHFPFKKWNLPELYLLCYPDLKWQADPLRENPNNRMELFRLHEQELQKINAPYVIITGSSKQRFSNAQLHIDKVFNITKNR